MVSHKLGGPDRPLNFAEHYLIRAGRIFRIRDTLAVPMRPDESDEHALTFVLIHGLATGSLPLHEIARQLTDLGRVLVLDLPGFDNLPVPPHPVDQRDVIEEFAEDVAHALDVLNASNAVLIGHSMGAQVAVEFAHRYRRGEGRLVLIAPCTHPGLRSVPRTLSAFGISALYERLGSALVSVQGYLYSGTRWTIHTLPGVVHYPIEERIRGIGGHVEILRGAHDRLSTFAWSQSLLASSGATGNVTCVAGAAHQVVVDHPRKVARAARLAVHAHPAPAEDDG